MSKKDVLVTDYVDPILLEGLRTLGYSLTYAPEMSRREMEQSLSSYTGVVINTRCAINRNTIESAPSLKWIARLGSGLDIIDLEAAEEKGIQVISAPEGNAQAVAEHAMGMLLCLANKIIQADKEVREGSWMREKNRGWEISGKTIGIIGFGNNGSAFANLWRGWDVKILAYDKYKKSFGNEHITEVTLDQLQQRADIISFHVPLTPETKEMFNEKFLFHCKTGVVVLNVSRGKVINLDALMTGLKSGQVKGACLDVFPFEPLSSSPEEMKVLLDKLYAMNNVVLTPHVAGWTVESKKKISATIVDKLKIAFPGSV